MSVEESKKRVEGWIRELGSTPVDVMDPAASWHLQFDYPAQSGHMLHVVSPKDHENRVVIVTGVNVAAEHRETFQEFDDDAKAEFAWELRKTLNVIDVDFQLDGVQAENDCPTRFQLSVTRYEDGLTLDSFARSVGAVYKTELNAVFLIRRMLGSKGFGGGRFDFKKLGL